MTSEQIDLSRQLMSLPGSPRDWPTPQWIGDPELTGLRRLPKHTDTNAGRLLGLMAAAGWEPMYSHGATMSSHPERVHRCRTEAEEAWPLSVGSSMFESVARCIIAVGRWPEVPT